MLVLEMNDGNVYLLSSLQYKNMQFTNLVELKTQKF